jgi:hypothetical protein
MAIVYQHRRKDTNEVFYVGIGKFRSRAYDTKSRNKHWIRIVKRAGYEVDILMEGLNWKDACTVETGLIQSIGRADLKLGPLVNLTDGGDGCLGRPTTTETKEKISRSHKGKKLSEEHRRNLSKAKIGKKRGVLSEEHKKRISESNKGKTFSEETKLKMKKAQAGISRPSHWKQVFQYTLDKVLLNTFESYSKAFEITGIRGIANNLSGRAKTAGGFIWTYKKL